VAKAREDQDLPARPLPSPVAGPPLARSRAERGVKPLSGCRPKAQVTTPPLRLPAGPRPPGAVSGCGLQASQGSAWPKSSGGLPLGVPPPLDFVGPLVLAGVVVGWLDDPALVWLVG
jgi:hypothetical protein